MKIFNHSSVQTGLSWTFLYRSLPLPQLRLFMPRRMYMFRRVLSSHHRMFKFRYNLYCLFQQCQINVTFCLLLSFFSLKWKMWKLGHWLSRLIPCLFFLFQYDNCAKGKIQTTSKKYTKILALVWKHISTKNTKKASPFVVVTSL